MYQQQGKKSCFKLKKSKNNQETKKMFAKMSGSFMAIGVVFAIICINSCQSSTFITPRITHPGKSHDIHRNQYKKIQISTSFLFRCIDRDDLLLFSL